MTPTRPDMSAFVLVPLEPTEAMLKAYTQGIRQMIAAEPEPAKRWPIKRYGYKLTERDKAIGRWRAMVRAAQAELIQGIQK